MFKTIKLLIAIHIAVFSIESQAMLRVLHKASRASTVRATSTRLCLKTKVGSVHKVVAALPSAEQNKKSQGSKKQSALRKYLPYAVGGAAIGYASSLLKKEEQQSAKQELEKAHVENAAYKAPWAAQQTLYRERLLATPWKAVSKEYLDSLDKEAQQLELEFLNLSGISKESYARFQSLIGDKLELVKTLEQKKAAKLLRLNGPYSNRITALLKATSFDTSKIEIYSSHDMPSPLAVSQSMFFVNQGLCNKFKDIKAFDAAVLHELVHLMEDDSFNGAVQRTLMMMAGLDSQKATDYFSKRDMFCEKRADILAGLVSPEYALALARDFHGKANPALMQKVADYMRTGAPRNYDSKMKAHPKHSERAAYLKELHQKMIMAAKSQKID